MIACSELVIFTTKNLTSQRILNHAISHTYLTVYTSYKYVYTELCHILRKCVARHITWHVIFYFQSVITNMIVGIKFRTYSCLHCLWLFGIFRILFKCFTLFHLHYVV